MLLQPSINFANCCNSLFSSSKVLSPLFGINKLTYVCVCTAWSFAGTYAFKLPCQLTYQYDNNNVSLCWWRRKRRRWKKREDGAATKENDEDKSAAASYIIANIRLYEELFAGVGGQYCGAYTYTYKHICDYVCIYCIYALRRHTLLFDLCFVIIIT